MKNSVKRFGALALSTVTAMSVLAGCKDPGTGGTGEQQYDTESRAVVFSQRQDSLS